MKKWVKLSMISAPIGIVVASVGTYLGLTLKSNTEKKIVIPVNRSSGHNSQTTNNDGDAFEKFDVFPTIRQEDYYQDIRIEAGHAYIPDDMVAKIASDIIKRCNMPGGSLNWNYRFEDGDVRKNLVLTFRWTPEDNFMFSKVKTYKIDISQDTI